MLALCIGLLAWAGQATAQLSGSYTIDPLGSGTTNYVSFAAAFSDLNTNGVSGAVTFNVKDGATFTESNLILNTIAGASATNTITFQRDNSGTPAPIISAAAGLSTNTNSTTVSAAGTTRDAIIILNGADFVTLRGLTLEDPAANATTTTQMEYGVLLLRTSNTNGPQNNTIQDCSITLQKGNTTSSSNTAIGIASLPFTLTTIGGTALSATGASADGRADGNKFYSNTIQNVNTGIYLLGLNDGASPYTYYDQGNDIGGTGAASATTGNTITNYGGSVASTTSYGIHINFQAAFQASNNTINNLTGGGTAAVSTLYGIFYNTTTNNVNVSYNYNTINITQGSNSATHGIYSNSGGGATNGSTTTMTHNTVTVSVTASTVAVSSESNGLFSAGSTGTVNLSDNTVTMNASTTGTVAYSGTVRGIYNNVAVTTLTMNNNTVTMAPSIAAAGAVSGAQSAVFNNGTVAGALNMNGNTVRFTPDIAGTGNFSGASNGMHNTSVVTTSASMSSNTFSWTRTGTGTGNGTATINALINTSTHPGGITFNANTWGPATGTAIVANTGEWNFIRNSTSTNSPTVTNNIMRNLSRLGSSTSAVHGYYNLSGGSGTQTFTSNQVLNIDVSNGGPANTGTLYGLYTFTAATQTQVFTNNTIDGLTNGGGAIYGIRVSSASPTSTYTGNTISNFYTYGGTNLQHGIDISSGGQTVSGNTISNLFTDGTGEQRGMSLTSGLAGANIFNNTVNTVSGSGTGANARYGIYHNPSSNAMYANTVTGISATNAASTGAVYGIYEEGGSATGMNCYGNTISEVQTSGTGNAFGLALTGTSGITNGYGNTIFNIAGTTGTVYGIYTSHSGTGVNVYKNKVDGLSLTGATGTVYGIYTDMRTLASNANVYNNLVRVTGLPTVGGVATGTFAAAGDNVLNGLGAGTTLTTGTVSGALNFSFNTVYLTGSSTASNLGSSGVFISSALPVVNLRNNIIDNRFAPGTTGATVAYRRSAAPTNANAPGATNSNNLYYAATAGAQNLLYAEGTATLANPQQTIAGFRSYFAPTSGGEQTSVTDAPDYLNTLDATNGGFLHLDPAQQQAAESGGTPISGITDDYDAQTRNTSTPDIGADEGTFIPKDLAPPSITYTALGNTNITTTRTLTTSITDASGVPTTGGNLPRLYYRKGTTGAYVSVAANTPVTAPTYTFTFDYSLVGGVTAGDVVQYYVAAQDNVTPLPNGTSSPAGTSDVNPPGSGGTYAGTPNSFTILPTLAGNYYVGTTVGVYGTPAYATLTAAADAYNLAGISGNVNFILVDAAYTGETYPITFNNNATSSAVNTLTIKPYTGITPVFSGSNSAALIKLNGARYVTLDGSNDGTTSRNWTLTNTATTAASTPVWIASNGVGAGSSFITVKNLNLSTGSITTTTSGISVAGTSVNSGGAANNNITLQNNNINTAYSGIYVSGTTTSQLTGLSIVDNSIGSNTAANYVSLHGINLSYATAPSITHNTIFNITQPSSSTTAVAGILFGDNVNTATVSRNYLYGFRQQNTGGYGVYGIAINSATGSNDNVISNNIITDLMNAPAGDGITSTFIPYGIRIVGGSGHRILYNTVVMTGTSTTTSASNSTALGINGGTLLDVRNNILINNIVAGTTSTTAGSFALSTGSGVTYSFINYNDYYVTGTSGKLGNINGTVVTTLAALRTATGGDAQSVSLDPGFTSSTNFKPLSAAFDNLGTPVTGVTTDYVLATRSATTPDMGAYEFTPPQDDARVVSIDTPVAPFAAGNQTITVTVGNTGVTNLTSVTLTYVYTPASGAPITESQTFTGLNLVAGAGTTTPLTFTVPVSVTGAGGTLVVTSSLPNGQVDANTPNDSQTRTLRPGLSGLYTVGAGTTPARDFVTLDAAVATLQSAGAVGAVTFSLTDATYPATSGIVVNEYPGASAANTLTIKPAAGVSPTLTSTTGASAVIRLNGADYVTIDGSNTAGGTTRDLTLTSLNTGTSAVVWVSSLGTGLGATNNTIKNTTLIGGSTSTTTAFGIYAAGTSLSTTGTGAANNNLTIQNNAIYKAYEAVYVRGVATTGLVTGLQVTGNSIGFALATAANTVTFRGVDVTNVTTPTISGNTIFGMQTTNSVNIAAIDLGLNTTDAVVSKNVIYSLRSTSTGGWGAYGVNVSSGTGTNAIEISNNMIADIITDGDGTSTTFNPFGIRITGGTNHKVYFNTVNLTGAFTNAATSDLGAALLVTGGSIDSRNNIFSNSMTGGTGTKSYAIYASSASLLATSNNNDYYVSGTRGVLGYVNGDVATLTALQAATTQDANSVNAAPVYTATPANAGDLHLEPNSNTSLNNRGTAVSVTVDIDNQTRSASTPDIGADEFTPTILDIAVTAINGPAAPFAAGTYATTATITNGGGPSVSSFDVSFIFNGVTTNLGTITLATPLATGATTTVSLGNLTYVNGPNTIAVTAINPNGTPEVAPADLANNTLSTTLYTALCGTYAVGVGGDFTTLDAAVNALNTAGATCAIVFNLTDATYPASSGITVNQFAGSSSAVTLTIKPATGVTSTLATTTSASFLLRLNGADYVTIDGSNNGSTTRNLTLTLANTAGGTTVLVSSLGTGAGATNNTIKNLNINGGSSTAGFGISAGGGAGAAGADNDNLSITNNAILRAFNGIYVGGFSATAGVAAVSVGGADGLVINNNIIGPATSGSDNITGTGLFLANLVSPSITGNTIQNMVATSGNVTGVVFNLSTGGSFTENTINQVTSTLDVYGLRIGTATGVLIDRNKITNIAPTATSNGYGGHGIDVSVAAASNITIRNNFVNAYGTNWTTLNSTSNAGTTGIRLLGSSGGINVYFNSVNLAGPAEYNSSTSLVSAAFYAEGSTTALNVRNNIFVNTMANSVGTGTNKFYAFNSAAAATAYTTINYNDYYVSGANGVLGFLAADLPTLADIQTATTQDANSVSIAPAFVSNTDLHINPLSSAMNNLGTPITGVTTDIDNQARNATTPDLGADEYTPVSGNVGITGLLQPSATNCYGGTRPIEVVIRNFGSTATNFTIPVTVNVTGSGAAQTVTTSVTRVIPAGDTIRVVVGTYVVNAGSGSYTFAASTNFANDANPGNDALAPVTVSVTVPDAISLVASPTAATTTGVCATSEVTLTASSSTPYTYTWTSPTGGMLNSTTGATVTANPTQTTTYTVTGVSGACTISATITINVNPLPAAPAVTPPSATICPGGSQTLTVATGPFVVGTGTTTNLATSTVAAYGPAPYGNYYGGNREQSLIRAAELTAAGLTAGTQITSLSFDNDAVNGNVEAHQNFRIAIGTTTQSAITTFQSGLTQVLAPATYQPVVGLNTHTFNTPFVWDGVSNLIVETSFVNIDPTDPTSTTFGENAQTRNSATSYTSTVLFRSDTNQDFTTVSDVSFTYSARPNMRFGTAAGSYTWTLVSGDGLPANANTASITVMPTVTSVYRVQTTNANSCVSPGTNVTVTVAPLPTFTTTVSNACTPGGTGTITVTAAAGTGSYEYSSNGGTAYQASNVFTGLAAGTYSILVRNLGGTQCVAAAPQSVTITAPTTALSVTATQANVTSPGGNDGTITATAADGTAPYQYSLDNGATYLPATPAAGAYTFTGLTAGSYTVTARDASGCTSTTTITVTSLGDLMVTTSQPNISGSYNNVTIVGPNGVATLGGNLTVFGTLTVQNGATLNTECQTIDGPGSFTLAAGGTLAVCAPAGIASTGTTGAIQLSGARSFSTDANYIYNGTVAQVTGNGLPARVRNLTVNNAAGVTLTQASSVAQVVRLQSGNLTLNGQALTLLSDATGTALVDNTGGVVIGTGTMQRAITSATPLGYRHYSSPVTTAPVSVLGNPVTNPAYNTSATPSAITPFPTVFGYNENRVGTVTSNYGPFDQGWFSPAATDNLAVTRGYTVNTSSATLVSFLGTFNNQTQNSGPLTRGTDAAAGWHLLGNPYPSPLDWTTVSAAQRPGVDAAMYVFQATGQYTGTFRSNVNGIGVVPAQIEAGQGYFVRVSAAGTPGAVNLTNANRVTTWGPQNVFGRSTADTRPQVQLHVAGAGLSDDAFVYFEQGATAGIDAEYDAVKLPNTTGLNLSSQQAGLPVAINGLPLLSSTATVVPLTLWVPAAGQFTFEVPKLVNFGTTTVYLRDAKTGTLTPLSAGTQHTVTLASASGGVSRFALVFQPAAAPLATGAGVLAAQVQLFPNPAHGQFTLTLPAVAGQRSVEASLINALGQKVISRHVALTATGALEVFDTANLAAGVYIMRLQLGTEPVNLRVTIE